MIFLLTACTLGAFLVLHLFWLYYTDTSKYDIPVFTGWNVPLFGNWLSMPSRKNNLKERSKWYSTINDTFLFWFFTKRFIFTRDRKVIQDLLSSQKYIKKSFMYWVTEEMLGNGLGQSYGELWQKRRKIITPTFHFDILDDYLVTVEDQSVDLVGRLQTYVDNKEEFDILPISKKFSLFVICETAMGLNLNKDDKDCGLEKWIKTVMTLFPYRAFRPWLWNAGIFKLTTKGRECFDANSNLKAFVRKIIERRIKLREIIDDDRGESKQKKKKIFLDTLLDAYSSGDIDVEGIMDEVFTFLVAGEDTTSTALSFCLYTLGRHPEIQEKLYHEIQHVSEKYGNLKNGGLKELEYMECVIKETLRIHPSVPIISREVEADTTLGGITFPSTAAFVVDIIALQRNPNVWESPMTFLPERFEKLSENQRRLFSFIPFSAGPRNCIGQRFAMIELKIALFHILKRFRVESTQKEEDLQQTIMVILSSDNGLMLRLYERV